MDGPVCIPVLIWWFPHGHGPMDFPIYVETDAPGIQRPAKGLALVYWPSGTPNGAVKWR